MDSDSRVYTLSNFSLALISQSLKVVFLPGKYHTQPPQTLHATVGYIVAVDIKVLLWAWRPDLDTCLAIWRITISLPCE